MASTKLGVPVASLSVSKGVVSGGGSERHLRRADRRQELRLHASPAGRRARTPGQGIAKPVEPVQARRHVTAADRHPGQGVGQVHLRPERADSGDVARPLGHAARHRRQHLAEPLPGQHRRELDQEHPGRSGRADQQLRRRRGAEGVRGDPGRGAAEGRLEERSEVRLGQLGQLLVVGAQGGRHEHDQPGPLHGRHAATSTLRWRRRRRRCRRPTSTTTTTSCRSARTPRSPTWTAERPRDRCTSRASRSRAIPPNLASTMLGIRGARNIRAICVRGLELVRRRHAGAGGRAGGDHLAGDRQAGAPPVDALGPARLRQLRPGRTCTT